MPNFSGLQFLLLDKFNMPAPQQQGWQHKHQHDQGYRAQACETTCHVVLWYMSMSQYSPVLMSFTTPSLIFYSKDFRNSTQEPVLGCIVPEIVHL